MKPSERQAYLAGVVDGLRQARWIKDKPSSEAVVCIRKWFYDDVGKSSGQIEQLMRRNPEKAAESILFVLIKKECGW